MTAPKKRLGELIPDYLEYLEIDRNYSPYTIRNYRHYLSTFLDWLKRQTGGETIDPEEIDVGLIRKWRLYLSRQKTRSERPLSRTTQGYYILALRSLFDHLLKQDYGVVPLSKIKVPRGEGRVDEFLTVEQVNRHLAARGISTAKGLRDKDILDVLFLTGKRVEVMRKL